MVVGHARGRAAGLAYPAPPEASGGSFAAGFAFDAVLLLVLALLC